MRRNVKLKNTSGRKKLFFFRSTFCEKYHPLSGLNFQPVREIKIATKKVRPSASNAHHFTTHKTNYARQCLLWPVASIGCHWPPKQHPDPIKYYLMIVLFNFFGVFAILAQSDLIVFTKSRPEKVLKSILKFDIPQS